MVAVRDGGLSEHEGEVSAGTSPVITGVHTALVDVPLGQRTITDSQSSVKSVEFLQVSIETDAGITGYGFNWNYTRGLRSVQVMIDDCFAPAVLGMPAFDRGVAGGNSQRRPVNGSGKWGR